MIDFLAESLGRTRDPGAVEVQDMGREGRVSPLSSQRNPSVDVDVLACKMR